MATGLCGSITTFSTWNVAAMKVLLGYPGSDVEGAAKVWTWLTILIVGLAAPYGAFIYGRDISLLSSYSKWE